MRRQNYRDLTPPWPNQDIPDVADFSDDDLEAETKIAVLPTRDARSHLEATSSSSSRRNAPT